MKMVLVLIGASGSGKSTWAQEFIKKNDTKTWKIISSDAIRAEFFGDEEDQTHNAEVFKIVFKRMKSALAKNVNVILDATNLTRKDRAKVFAQCADEDISLSCAYFRVPASVCKARQGLRRRRVPDRVVERQCNHLEPPTADEGWHTIMTIRG